MRKYFEMTPSQRRHLFDETAAQLNLPEVAVEKDFWVCWILKNLFMLPEFGHQLTFKGGTSLSKGWDLIDRFSEDVDIVIGRESLGFGGENAPELAPSKKQMRKRLDALKVVCQKCIKNELAPKLSEIIKTEMPDSLEWELKDDPDDLDSQTLLFHYPSVYEEGAAYLRRAVKIEMGARSDTDPSESIKIAPYVNNIFPDLFSEMTEVHVVSPKRTFWEKCMLLYEETFRPNDKKKRKRFLARHYYDVFCLIKAGVAEEAAKDIELFKRIAAHRQVFFRYSWVDYSTLVPGQLRMLPLESQMKDWRSDYENMETEMFFGDVPGFDEVIKTVQVFQETFNQSSER
jgi:predicted nucleotidyltransferase component of viral defense system